VFFVLSRVLKADLIRQSCKVVASTSLVGFLVRPEDHVTERGTPSMKVKVTLEICDNIRQHREADVDA